MNIDELKVLDVKATPGLWSVSTKNATRLFGSTGPVSIYLTDDDLRLVFAMRNALPELVEEYELSERQLYRTVKERDAAEARADKAEAERDVLARKFAEVSDNMNGHNPPLSFCHACNVCQVDSDIEMEGVTCEVRLLEWVAQGAAERDILAEQLADECPNERGICLPWCDLYVGGYESQYTGCSGEPLKCWLKYAVQEAAKREEV